MRDPEPPLPESPTAALPGTEEKVKVLCERAQLGERLWHPQDGTWGNANPEEAGKQRVGRFASNECQSSDTP